MMTSEQQRSLDKTPGKLVILGLIFLTASCAVVPRKTVYFDEECNIYRERMHLAVVPKFTSENPLKRPDARIYVPRKGIKCSGGQCIKRLVLPILGSAITLPVTAIVSGSIAGVSNVFYKINEVGKRCVEDHNPTSDTTIDVESEVVVE